jgi:ABC-type uncharacterized transport system substrate-binding protein
LERRAFLKGLGGVVTWTVAAEASANDVRTIGVLGITSLDTTPERFSAFRRGLRETGYVEGRNLAIEYRLASGQREQLPLLAADLVQRHVAVIATNGGSMTALAAMSATSTIPIVFTTGDDPVRLGLVASISHPGANATGVTMSSTELVDKRLELLRQLVPGAKTVALLMGGGFRSIRFWTEDSVKAAQAAGLKAIALEIESGSDLQPIIAGAIAQGADAMLVAAAPLLMRRKGEIVALAARYALPTVFPFREFCQAGGLMSYGPDLVETYHQAGIYCGRILNGASPSELPVQLPTRFELVINLKAAKTLGIELPRLLNARVDKVIE